jgi:hypothetical protein
VRIKVCDVEGPVAWREEQRLLARWPSGLQVQYLAALDRFDPPIPDVERQRLEAVVRRHAA